MKLTIMLVLIGSLQIHAAVLGQTITLSEQNAPLEKIFQEKKKKENTKKAYKKRVATYIEEWLN